jgi:predicted transcriptional regulator
MFRFSYHPNAFLTQKRNIKPGLSARTKIILTLESRISTTMKISRETDLTYSVVLYHLHLLEADKIITHRGGSSYVWELTGVGQRRLIDKK